jgi:hypothetical protein
VLQSSRGAATFPWTTYPGKPEHVKDFPEKWKSLEAALVSNSNFGKVPRTPPKWR